MTGYGYNIFLVEIFRYLVEFRWERKKSRKCRRLRGIVSRASVIFFFARVPFQGAEERTNKKRYNLIRESRGLLAKPIRGLKAPLRSIAVCVSVFLCVCASLILCVRVLTQRLRDSDRVSGVTHDTSKLIRDSLTHET